MGGTFSSEAATGMVYNLSTEYGVRAFGDAAERLRKKGALAELSERRTRSLSQNAYLHVALQRIASEWGEDVEYVKQVLYKVAWNEDIFVRSGHDGAQYLRSSSSLTEEEMMRSIDSLRDHASKDMGIYIPDPKEKRLAEEFARETIAMAR